MKEYLLELKIKNNYLFEQMLRVGIKTNAELAKAANVHPTAVGMIMNMKEVPYNLNGDIRPYVDKVLDTLGCGVEDIYPPEQIEKALSANIYKARVEAEQLRVMLESEVSIDSMIEHSERAEALDTAIDSAMNERHAKVIRLRYMEGKTLEATAAIMGVTRERIRQMEAKGIRGLRHPKYSDSFR